MEQYLSVPDHWHLLYDVVCFSLLILINLVISRQRKLKETAEQNAIEIDLLKRRLNQLSTPRKGENHVTT